MVPGAAVGRHCSKVECFKNKTGSSVHQHKVVLCFNHESIFLCLCQKNIILVLKLECGDVCVYTSLPQENDTVVVKIQFC